MERKFDMVALVEEARKHDSYDSMSEDSCDFCGCDTIVSSINGHDIFLEGWRKSLACLNCAEEFSIVTKWTEWHDMKTNKASGEELEAFEKDFYKKVKALTKPYRVRG